MLDPAAPHSAPRQALSDGAELFFPQFFGRQNGEWNTGLPLLRHLNRNTEIV